MNELTHLPESQVRSFRFEAAAEADTRSVSGCANGIGVWDSHGTRFMPGCFAGQRQSVPLLWAHDRRQPIGRTSVLVEDGDELRFDARLTRGVRQADEALALIADSAIDEVSIGFDAVEWREIEGPVADDVRKAQRLPAWWPVVEYTKARVREVSPVPFGSNPQTDIAMRAARDSASSLDEYRRRLAGPVGDSSPEDNMPDKNPTTEPAKPESGHDNLDQIRADLTEMRALLAANKLELAEANREREEAKTERDFVKFCSECAIGSTFKVDGEAAQRALFSLKRSDADGYNALAAVAAPPAAPAIPAEKPRIVWGARHGSSDVTEPETAPTNSIELKAACLRETGGDEVKATALFIERAPKMGIL